MLPLTFLYSLGLYELGIDAADALPPLKPTSCSSDWIGYNPRSNFRYETGHGNDKAEKARAPIRQGHVEGSRCAREERVRYPWEAVRADQPNAPPGSSAEANTASDGRSGNYLQLASAR